MRLRCRQYIDTVRSAPAKAREMLEANGILSRVFDGLPAIDPTRKLCGFLDSGEWEEFVEAMSGMKKAHANICATMSLQ